MKIILLILLFCFSVLAQQSEKYSCSNADKSGVREYFQQIELQNKFIAECKEKSRKEILKKTGNPPIKIAGGCEWTNNGCPVNLVLPKFPLLARELKISGEVNVEIIINREGKIIYAKALSGHKLLRIFAVEAACKSRFSPKIFCEIAVFEKRIIRYNFIF